MGQLIIEDNAEFGFGMKLAQDANRAALKNKLDEILASTDNADVKAAIDEYYATYEDGEANAKATDKLVAALEACGCDKAQEILKEKEFLSRSHSGYSVVTDGLMISVTADLIMFLQQTRMSMYSYSIQKFILTQADRLLSLLTLVQSLSSQQQVRMLRRKTLQQLL